MATNESVMAVRRREGAAIIDLAGDIDSRAERPLEAAWDEAAAEPGAVVLNFEGAHYINSTGIALIVGLLARGRADPRLRPLRPLPGDLRDHAAGRLHADRHRRGQRRGRRGKDRPCLKLQRPWTFAGMERRASWTFAAT